jgi:hypothetical protein
VHGAKLAPVARDLIDYCGEYLANQSARRRVALQELDQWVGKVAR